MGISISKNATKIVYNAITKISTKIAQDTAISYDSSQVIYISHVDGDVIISGNTFIQRAHVNMQAMFNALTDTEAQQNLAIELSQTAKSQTSGFNLYQFSYAENDMDIFIQTAIDITTEISQSCAVLAKQDQRIIIEYAVGTVKITNNLFEQIADIYSSCIQESITHSKALQTIIAKLKQDSSASSEGISLPLWIFAVLLAILIGIPVLGVATLGVGALVYIFPVIMLTGIIFLIIYYATLKNIMPIKGYSNFIENTPGCLAVPPHPPPLSIYESAEAAGTYCLNQSDCAAFDWKGIDITQTGSYTLTKPPQTKIYSSVSSECRSAIKEDNVNMIRSPILYSGPSQPPSSIPNLLKGDLWINTTTSIWYQLDLNWITRGTLVKDKFVKITVQNKPPDSTQSGISGEFVVVYTPDDPGWFGIFFYDTSKPGNWDAKNKVSGPGYFAAAPNITNASGVKEQHGTQWLLWAGIACTAVGAGGTIFSFIYNNSGSSSDNVTNYENSVGNKDPGKSLKSSNKSPLKNGIFNKGKSSGGFFNKLFKGGGIEKGLLENPELLAFL